MFGTIWGIGLYFPTRLESKYYPCAHWAITNFRIADCRVTKQDDSFISLYLNDFFLWNGANLTFPYFEETLIITI